MVVRLGSVILAGVATLVVAEVAHVISFFDGVASSRSCEPASSIKIIDANLEIQVLRELPDLVTALATCSRSGRSCEDVFVGTGPAGSVFRFSPILQCETLIPVASGLGDFSKFGTCEVSALAVCDLNQDGTLELLAGTSQISPRGRPRLYAWSLGDTPIPLGMVRPEIESSWSHGLGVAHVAHGDAPSAFATFCGYGEIVEYQATRDTSASGFQLEGISWRQVGRLPASGEQALAADADNDGQTDLCLATGYSLGKAAIHIYAIGSQGIEAQPRHVIDESGRFGNVRFLVGDLESDGTRDLVAWWCSDVSGGDCEMIRYRLGPDGLRQRTEIICGDADQLWPHDGQMALADIDQDGNIEAWFSTYTGNLWRYQPNQAPPATQLCAIVDKLGPLVASALDNSKPACLYLGSGRSVLRVQSQR
jgi:hypothetical protein